MNVDVILGLQWGDEGKGKIVDHFAPEYDIVARFQGGPNAGHTLNIEGNETILHTIPSGILQDGTLNLVGNGMVLDPVVFKEEVETLRSLGVNVKEKIRLSRKAHLILPTHRLLDAAAEARKGKDKIGSTLKGIGPAYMDKTGRNGLRIGDIDQDNFQEHYDYLINKHEDLLGFYDYSYDLEKYQEEWREGIEMMRSMPFVDGEYFINEAIEKGQSILAEGAQGAMLDIDFGSYPYVTSSNTITAGVCTGLGVAPSQINRVIGIAKAYCTRVGNGPFPTELTGKQGDRLREAGNEFGSTTGRPRRCGWIDLPVLQYTSMLNGVTELILTKVDVLNDFDRIGVGTHYQIGERTTTQVPFRLEDVSVEPQYKYLPGWNQSIGNEIPPVLEEYLNFLEESLDLDIPLISVGPKRSDVLQRSASPSAV